MNESILQQLNCCVSCYFIAFFTVFLTLFMSNPSSHKKLESPLVYAEDVTHCSRPFSLIRNMLQEVVSQLTLKNLCLEVEILLHYAHLIRKFLLMLSTNGRTAASGRQRNSCDRDIHLKIHGVGRVVGALFSEAGFAGSVLN